MGLGDRTDNKYVEIKGQRIQEESALRKFMVTLEAQETAKKQNKKTQLNEIF